MKKRYSIEIFGCILVLVFFCFGCNYKTPQKDIKHTTEYKTVIADEHFKVQRNDQFETKYFIYDMQGSVVQVANVGTRPLNICRVYENILEIQIGYGTGATTNQYYNILQNDFSPIFQDVIATSGKKVVFLKETTEATALVVQSIFDDTYYKEFALSEEQINMIEIHFTQNEQRVVLSYFSNGEQKAIEFLL